jgi:hypothetical protein
LDDPDPKVKRSNKIALVLLGSVSAGAFSACGQSTTRVRISTECVYVNDYYVPGAGYYHAPFQRFYPFRYNHYDPNRKQFYFGGNWGPLPYQSVVNVSAPTPDAAAFAEAARSDIRRGGFGGSSSRHYFSC